MAICSISPKVWSYTRKKVWWKGRSCQVGEWKAGCSSLKRVKPLVRLFVCPFGCPFLVHFWFWVQFCVQRPILGSNSGSISRIWWHTCKQFDKHFWERRAKKDKNDTGKIGAEEGQKRREKGEGLGVFWRTSWMWLVEAKARGETHLMRQRTKQAWRLRWGSLLSCVAARVVATLMLELPGARGADGETLAATDVEQDSRNAGCVWLCLVSLHWLLNARVTNKKKWDSKI